MTRIKLSQLIAGFGVIYAVGFAVGLWVGRGTHTDDQVLDLQKENLELKVALDRVVRDRIAETDLSDEITLPPQSVLTD